MVLRSTGLVGLLKELRLCTAISGQRNLRRSPLDLCCGLEDIRNLLILLFANVRPLYLSQNKLHTYLHPLECQ